MPISKISFKPLISLPSLPQEQAEWLAVLEESSVLANERLVSKINPADEIGKPNTEPVLEEAQRQTHAALSFQVRC